MPTLEVVYAPSAAELWHVKLSFVPGMTVADALNQSAIFERYPEARELLLGIFSKRASYNTVLRPGDRIELYRPLVSDPKDARRKRALARQKALKQRP